MKEEIAMAAQPAEKQPATSILKAATCKCQNLVRHVCQRLILLCHQHRQTLLLETL